jgi:hypothetical protein
MYSIMIFFHVISATLMGCFLVFPFLSGKAAALEGQEQLSYVGLMTTLNRIAQFALIVSFLTGGAMVSKVEGISVTWMIVSIVLFLAVAATSGIMGANLKRMITTNKAATSTSAAASKVQTFSWLSGILLLLVLYVMTHPGLFAGATA